MPVGHIAALFVALTGCVTDLRSRRVPNELTLGAACGAWALAWFEGGWPGLGWSMAGWGIGLLLFLPLFALRGLGGGDVKLVAALGAFVGPGLVIWLALYAALAGGVLGLAFAAARGYTKEALANVWSLLTYWRVVGVREHPTLTLESPNAVRFPYAVPIAAGLAVALWLR